MTLKELQQAATDAMQGAQCYLTRRTYSTPGYVKRYAIAAAPVVVSEGMVGATFTTLSEPALFAYLIVQGEVDCVIPLDPPLQPADFPVKMSNGWKIDRRPTQVSDEDLAALKKSLEWVTGAIQDV